MRQHIQWGMSVKTLNRGYTMTEQVKQKNLIPVLRTLFILAVSALAFGTEAMAQPGNADNPGAGVAAILDEDTVPEEASLKTTEQEVRVGEAALAVSVGRVQNKSTRRTQKEELELVMTNVSNTLNVRKEPEEEAEKVGYLYADCGGTILERKDGWTKLESGGLIGWAKDEYLLFEEDAIQEARQVGRTMATVTGDTLRIRKEPDADAGVYALAARGESFEVVGESELEFSDGIHLSEDWAAIDYEGRTGYISSEFITVDFEVDSGETLEEIAAREAAQTKAMTASTETSKGGRTKADTSAGEIKKENAGVIPAGASDAQLLAALIQCEAGGESYEGQLAVGAVVINRVRSGSYPATVSGVIYASGQFGPAGTGKVASLLSGGNIKNSCLQAANEAISGITNVGNATHFRRAGSREGIVIGNHVFW